MEILSGRFTRYIPKERKGPDTCGPGKASKEHGGREISDPPNKCDTAGLYATPGGQTQNRQARDGQEQDGQAAGGLQTVQQIQDSGGLKEILGLQVAEENAKDPAAMLKEHLEKAKEAKLGKTSKPQDSSGSLTRRLVSARRQLAVRQILAEASSNLAGLRMTASFGNEEDSAFARACIKRLEKLIRRAGRKIRALDGEDRMRVREKQAELVRQKDRATEIREQLRKQKVLRHMRENGYLLEELHEQIFGNLRHGGGGGNGANSGNSGDVRLSGAEEAAIARQAEVMASLEAASGVPGESGEINLADGSAAGVSQTGNGSGPGGSGSGGSGGTGGPGGGLDVII